MKIGFNMAGKSITGASPPPPKVGSRFKGRPRPPSSPPPIKAICWPSPFGFDVPPGGVEDERGEDPRVGGDDEPTVWVSGFTSSPLGDKARKGLEPSFVVVVVVVAEKVASEEGGVDGLRTGFRSLADGNDDDDDDDEPKAAAAPLLFVACVEANRNGLSATVGFPELLASNDNNDEKGCPVLSLPSSSSSSSSSGALTST